MNIGRPQKIVLLGFMSHFPVAGVAWQTIHYLVGFQRLGFDVYYVEAHGCTPSKLMQEETDDGAARAAAYIGGIMNRFGLERRWAYHAIYEGRCFGMSDTQLADLSRSAALIINLHGSHLPNPEWTTDNRLVYLGTDPVDIEIDLYHKKQEAIDYLRPHGAFFSYGENLGHQDCLVPVPEMFKFHPTRQPVVMDFWESCGSGKASTFTTIGNWRQPWREVRFKGELYRWSKHWEFQKFNDLPRRVAQPFELALSSFNERDQTMLESKGWRVRPALEFSTDLDTYRRYIGDSRGEFTVAKDQNVRLRSGWFSDRAATYLAAGRPVITQETGFSRVLPTGEGLFAFSTMEEIVSAVEAINADYERHRKAAWNIAREHLSHDVVLTRLLRDLGFPSKAAQPAKHNGVNIPPGLVITPKSRWPTRLPDETLQTALDLPTPVASETASHSAARASLIVVTYNGLAYTKLCLASLFSHGWTAGDELLIVDNASTDGTRRYLEEVARLNPFVRVFLNPENRGFSQANNQAMQEATGDILILLNNDTLLVEGWRTALARWLADSKVGMVGPVTNRTCNEAQIDAPYRTYGELVQFARDYTGKHAGQADDIRMLALFCAAMRRAVFKQIGLLDERFEIGMFEDDDYAIRLREAGYRLLCAEDVFVHHAGQASLGELCSERRYDQIFEANRRRFEEKWRRTWQPHSRRVTPEYQRLRQRIQAIAATQLPAKATILVASKGDEELLKLNGQRAWHFPQAENGAYPHVYPADSTEAIAQLESAREKGAQYLVFPKPAFWWLEYYVDFKKHLERTCRLAVLDEETCVIYDLGGFRA